MDRYEETAALLGGIVREHLGSEAADEAYTVARQAAHAAFQSERWITARVREASPVGLDPHGYERRVYAVDEACACRAGHRDCAAWNGGPCLDEVLTRHERDGGCEECRA